MKYKFLLFPLQSHISLSKVSFGVRNYTTQRLAFQKNAIHSSNRSHFHTSSAVWEKDSHSTPIPQLMNSVDMRIMKPSLFKLFTNHISARLIITPYFDNDFNIPDFKIGAKQAIVAVSSALSSGNIAALEVFLYYSKQNFVYSRCVFNQTSVFPGYSRERCSC